jgi:hypothetical protein
MAGFFAECPRLWQPQDDCAIDRERFLPSTTDGGLLMMIRRGIIIDI